MSNRNPKYKSPHRYSYLIYTTESQEPYNIGGKLDGVYVKDAFYYAQDLEVVYVVQIITNIKNSLKKTRVFNSKQEEVKSNKEIEALVKQHKIKVILG